MARGRAARNSPPHRFHPGLSRRFPGPSYDMDAAFMSFQPHESGIHAVWSGAGEASVTKVRFKGTPARDHVIMAAALHP
jgi:hypothetical protein